MALKMTKKTVTAVRLEIAAAPRQAWTSKRSFYGTLAYENGRWFLSGIEPHVAIKLKNVFPSVPKSETKVFAFPDTPQMCTDLDWFTYRYPMEMKEADRNRLKGATEKFHAKRSQIERILSGEVPVGIRYGFKPGKKPYEYQEKEAEIAHRLGRLLIMDDVGLGKTVAACRIMAGSNRLPAAVIADAHMPSQWVKEFIEPFTYLVPHVIQGVKPYELPPANVYLFRYSNIHGWTDIAATGMFKAVVFDEMQSLRRGLDTEKGKAAEVFANNAQLRVGLTATPVYGYGSEIFHLVNMLEPGCLGEWTEFVREWCTGQDGKWVVKEPDALGTYLRELQLVVRHERQGRPANRIVVKVGFDEKVAKKAEELARILAMQVTTGKYWERGQAARELDTLTRMTTGVAKAKTVAAYVRILLNAGKPVLLVGWHRSVYKIWMQELAEFNPVLYTGTESASQKDQAKMDFINGKTMLKIMSLRSGIGLDGLQRRCSTLVFGEFDWSNAVHSQCIGRLDRPGQKEDIIDVVYPFCDYGSDPVVMEVHGIKASQQRGIVDPGKGVERVYSDESRIKKLAERYLTSGGLA